MTDTVTLVACVGTKRDRPMFACVLYNSAWFRKAKSYATRREGASWYILSAKYGVLHPHDVIEPYDQPMWRTKTAAEPWAELVATQCKRRFKPGTVIEMIAGRYYAEPITPKLRELGFIVVRPLKGMGIGEQMRWLATRTSWGKP